MVRQAVEQLWSMALAEARTEATEGLAQERASLAGEREDLVRAREAQQAQLDGMAERERLMHEALTLARGQSDEASQRAAMLQARLDRSEADLGAARQVVADLVQQHAAERRTQSEQLRAQAADTKVLQERAAAAERRLLEDVDRARQEAKQAKRELADAQRAHEKELRELGRASQQLGAKWQEAQIEVASLRERLAGAEGRATDLQKMLSPRAGATKPRPAARKAVKKVAAQVRS